MVFLIFLSMNVIVSCLPLKYRLAFVYCHGHYYEMSWFIYLIFWFKQVETPRHICEKSFNYYHYYYEYYYWNYLLLLLLLLLEVLTRDFSSDVCTLLSLTSFLARFPALNSLIQRINVRKRRDSIILASVISICIILMLIYALGWILINAMDLIFNDLKLCLRWTAIPKSWLSLINLWQQEWWNLD